MAVIDSIRTLFTADTSGLEAGAKKARGILGQLQALSGKSSPLGQITSLVKGGGAIAGVTVAARELAEVAERFKESRDANDSWQTTALKTIPIVNNLYSAFSRLGEVIYSGTKRLQELEAAQAKESVIRKTVSSLVDQVDALYGEGKENKVDAVRAELEALQDTLRKSPTTFRKELILIEESLERLEKFPFFEFGQEVSKMIAEAETALSDMNRESIESAFEGTTRWAESMEKFADGVRNAVDPFSAFTQDVDALTDALHAGYITMDEYLSRLSQIENEFVGVDDAISALENSMRNRRSVGGGGPTGAKTFGSQEAYVAMATNSVNQRAMEEAKRQTEILKRQLQELRRLRDELGSDAEIVVDIP